MLAFQAVQSGDTAYAPRKKPPEAQPEKNAPEIGQSHLLSLVVKQASAPTSGAYGARFEGYWKAFSFGGIEGGMGIYHEFSATRFEGGLEGNAMLAPLPSVSYSVSFLGVETSLLAGWGAYTYASSGANPEFGDVKWASVSLSKTIGSATISISANAFPDRSALNLPDRAIYSAAVSFAGKFALSAGLAKSERYGAMPEFSLLTDFGASSLQAIASKEGATMQFRFKLSGF